MGYIGIHPLAKLCLLSIQVDFQGKYFMEEMKAV